MINIETEPIIAVGAIIAGIPTVDKLDKNPITTIQTGKHVIVDADKGVVEVEENGPHENKIKPRAQRHFCLISSITIGSS